MQQQKNSQNRNQFSNKTEGILENPCEASSKVRESMKISEVQTLLFVTVVLKKMLSFPHWVWR